MEKRLATPEELELIRGWLQTVPYIPLQTCDDYFLQRFFCHRKGSLQETKENILSFFKRYMILPRELLLFDINNENTQEYYKISYDFILPDKTPEGAIVTYHSLRSPYCKNLTQESILETRRRDFAVIWGFPPTDDKVIVIIDTEGLSMASMAQWNLDLLRQHATTHVKALPFRVVAVHLVNVSPITVFVSKLLASLLNEKFRNRIFCHSSMDTLHEWVPKEILPSDLGGDLSSCQELNDNYKCEQMKTNNDRFIELQKHWLSVHGKFNEFLMQKMDTNSFRKLDVD